MATSTEGASGDQIEVEGGQQHPVAQQDRSAQESERAHQVAGTLGLTARDQSARMAREVEQVDTPAAERAGAVARNAIERGAIGVDREARLQRLDQLFGVVAPAAVRELDRLAARELGERRRQVRRCRHGRAFDQHGNDRHPRRQRELDFEAHEVVRVIEAAAAFGVASVEPAPADDR